MQPNQALIYVVDDDASMRKSLYRLLGSSGFDVEVFDSANSFFLKAEIKHPCCLVLDLVLPDTDGLSFQKKLLENDILLPIVFITGYGNIPKSVQAMKMGAVDFLIKPFEAKDLIDAVSRSIQRDIIDHEQKMHKEEIRATLKRLTKRETEVMKWLITGKLNKQIAAELGTSEKTIKVHRGRILEKMNVSSIAELVRLVGIVGIEAS
jgi:FixJ family two-component response regulator